MPVFLDCFINLFVTTTLTISGNTYRRPAKTIRGISLKNVMDINTKAAYNMETTNNIK
jgi:hypothetical protein